MTRRPLLTAQTRLILLGLSQSPLLIARCRQCAVGCCCQFELLFLGCFELLSDSIHHPSLSLVPMTEMLFHHCQPLSTQHGRLLSLLFHYLPLTACRLHQLSEKGHILCHISVLSTCLAAIPAVSTLLTTPLPFQLRMSLLLSLPPLPPVSAHSCEQFGVMYDVL